MRAISLLKAN